MKLEYEKLGISYQKPYKFYYEGVPIFIGNSSYYKEEIKRLSIVIFGGRINGIQYFDCVTLRALRDFQKIK